MLDHERVVQKFAHLDSSWDCRPDEEPSPPAWFPRRARQAQSSKTPYDKKYAANAAKGPADLGRRYLVGEEQIPSFPTKINICFNDIQLCTLYENDIHRENRADQEAPLEPKKSP